jgi:hypothetical protein
MATLQAIRTAVDNRLTALWPAVVAKQDAYAANHGGRFWQGIRTHVINPSEGNTALPTIGTLCPSDQLGEPWPVAIRNLAIEMAVQCDCYDGPAGFGYAITVWVDVLGTTYARTQQVGAETWRTEGWHVVANSPV